MAQQNPNAERCPGIAVEKAADRLTQRDRAFDADPKHESRCALNAAGTDETMKTTHRVIVHVPHDRVEDFKQAATEVAETLGVGITGQDDRGPGERKRFILRP